MAWPRPQWLYKNISKRLLRRSVFVEFSSDFNCHIFDSDALWRWKVAAAVVVLAFVFPSVFLYHVRQFYNEFSLFVFLA